MDCERIRELLTQDPAAGRSDVDRHLSECASCHAYAARVRASDRLIEEALRFDVDAIREQAPRTRARRKVVWTQFTAGVAAGVAAAALFWAVMTNGPDMSVEALAGEVVAHWYEEPDSWQSTDVAVANVVLTAALDGKAQIDVAQLGTVTYARSCFVAGEWIPHLVVQGSNGPFMVLLLPQHQLDEPLPLSLPQEGLGGRVIPAGAGSIAIFGEGDADVDQLRQSVVAAVEWTI